jgi:hypothetical protein
LCCNPIAINIRLLRSLERSGLVIHLKTKGLPLLCNGSPFIFTAKIDSYYCVNSDVTVAQFIWGSVEKAKGEEDFLLLLPFTFAFSSAAY